jgi:hypothetical protein
LETYYSSFVGASNIVADYNIEAEHCLPTLSYGENCKTLLSRYNQKNICSACEKNNKITNKKMLLGILDEIG